MGNTTIRHAGRPLCSVCACLQGVVTIVHQDVLHPEAEVILNPLHQEPAHQHAPPHQHSTPHKLTTEPAKQMNTWRKKPDGVAVWGAIVVVCTV